MFDFRAKSLSGQEIHHQISRRDEWQSRIWPGSGQCIDEDGPDPDQLHQRFVCSRSASKWNESLLIMAKGLPFHSHILILSSIISSTSLCRRDEANFTNYLSALVSGSKWFGELLLWLDDFEQSFYPPYPPQDLEAQFKVATEARAKFSRLNSVQILLICSVNTLAQKACPTGNGSEALFKAKRLQQVSLNEPTVQSVFNPNQLFQACCAFAFITIPTLRDPLVELDLTVAAAHTALKCRCFHQFNDFIMSFVAVLGRLSHSSVSIMMNHFLDWQMTHTET